GLSIAWAAIEHLHETNRCRALFATHFHELTALAARLPRLFNATVRVKEWEGEVVFLHEVVPGAADRSYGIQVAKLAGLPPAPRRARPRDARPRQRRSGGARLPGGLGRAAAFCRHAAGSAASRQHRRGRARRAFRAASGRDVAARGARGALRAQGQGGGGRLGMHKLAALILLTCIAGAASAQAQSYPTRTITLTVTAAAGGVTDVVARALGQHLAESWGQQVVIENRGGAAHVVGAQSVAKAAPDGYSLLVAEAGTFTINPTLYGKGKLPYDEEHDFVPITGIVRINQALLGHPSLAADSVRELIALAKKQPGELTYGTAGIGSAPHMNIVLFESM